MRYSVRLLLLLSAVLLTTIARPSETEESNESEGAEYEGDDDGVPEETGQEDEESHLNDQDASDFDEDEENGRDLMTMHQHPKADHESDGGADSELVSDYSQKKNEGVISEEAPQEDNDSSPLTKHRQFKNIDNSDVNEQPDLHLTNYKTKEKQVGQEGDQVQGDAQNKELDKTTVDSRILAVDDSESAYEDDRENSNDGERIECDDAVAAGKQGHHFKQSLKSILGDHYENANRDRRQADTILPTTTEKKLPDFSNEDEAAIKSSIKRLSGDELKQILKLLSDDKKDVLNKIINSDSSCETLKKREITKKSGAVEEGFIDSSYSELSKVQGCPSIDVNTESTKSTSIDKLQQSENESVDTANQKSFGTTLAELAKQTDDADSNLKAENNLISSELGTDTFDTQSTKSENNRKQANLDDVSNSDESFDDSQDFDDSINEPEHIYSQDELAQLLDNEALLHDSNEHHYKREAAENEDLDESIKSLEESFPNSNSEENAGFESEMAPLVRVKRRNEGSLKKMRTADFPESKVAYVPYRAENEDEDNEEGSEFHDEGFFDRTSNNVKYDKLNDLIQSKSKAQENIEDPVSIASSNTNLDSDSDSVISNVGKADETLMYSGGTRNKRNAEYNDLIETENEPLRYTPFLEGKPRENLPNYQDIDSFGPLPRNPAEFTRYKRIRRVKPTHTDITVLNK